jgi:hypothetical protein
MPENQTSSFVKLAILSDIRSPILVKTYGTFWQADVEHPIKLYNRLQCCHIEENEFERLFDEIDAEFERLFDETDVEFERLWLDDTLNGTGSKQPKAGCCAPRKKNP